MFKIPYIYLLQYAIELRLHQSLRTETLTMLNDLLNFYFIVANVNCKGDSKLSREWFLTHHFRLTA